MHGCTEDDEIICVKVAVARGFIDDGNLDYRKIHDTHRKQQGDQPLECFAHNAEYNNENAYEKQPVGDEVMPREPKAQKQTRQKYNACDHQSLLINLHSANTSHASYASRSLSLRPSYSLSISMSFS